MILRRSIRQASHDLCDVRNGKAKQSRFGLLPGVSGSAISGVGFSGHKCRDVVGKRSLTRTVLHAQSTTMLTVHTAPVVFADQWPEWQLIFWLGDAFDYQTPFRAALDEIAFTLAQSKPTNIDLPVFAEREEFVEGHLSFGGTAVRIYYEYSLGYLALSSQDRCPLDEIEALTRPVTHIR